MNSSTPLVSVVIPAYNAAWCVARALDSVLVQDYRPMEIIVVDDGSDDDTHEVLAQYGRNIRLLRKANGGLSSARNAGIDAALGDYVAFLDADDWWLPGKLSRQVVLMQSRPDFVFCSTSTIVQTPEGAMLLEWHCGSPEGSPLEHIFRVNAFVAGSGSAVLARRWALDNAGRFDERLRSLEDIDLWMRLAALGGYACIDDPLTVILKRADSMSGNLDVMRASAIRVMKKNRHLLPPGRQGAFWRAAYAAMLSDYAKWEYRQGRSIRAALHLLQGLALAPRSKGRMLSGLLLAVATRQKL